MRALYLLRHSLTRANALRLYGGSTDLPLTAEGRALALARRGAIPGCGLYVSSGMRRADETLLLMTGRTPDLVLPGLREMDFGAFEMKSYEQLSGDADYLRWIDDATGDVCCPGGESANAFAARVRREGARLLCRPEDAVCAVCHGGTVVSLMQAWFPEVQRHFYQWQPGPCAGYRIAVADGVPAAFEEV